METTVSPSTALAVNLRRAGEQLDEATLRLADPLADPEAMRECLDLAVAYTRRAGTAFARLAEAETR